MVIENRDCSVSDQVVLHLYDMARRFLIAGATERANGLVEEGGDALYANALCQRGELDERGEIIACGPGLVGEHEGIHQLVGPGILDLQGLLVLQRLGGKRPQDSYGTGRSQIGREARADGRCTQLVEDRRTTIGEGRGRGGQRAANAQLEGEEVPTGLEGMAVFLLALEEGPVVVADDIDRRRAVNNVPEQARVSREHKGTRRGRTGRRG